MAVTGLRTALRILGPSGSERGYEHRPPREPWLMVPKNGTRALTLSAGGDPITVSNADDHGAIRNFIGLPACRVRVVGNQLFVHGLLDYRDIPIDLVHRGQRLRVMVSVKHRRTLPIIAHYVEHGPLLKTRMSRELLREIIDQANAMLFQANVHLSLALESVLTHERIFGPGAATNSGGATKPTKRSLGPVVKKDELHLLKKRSLTVPYDRSVEYPPANVFLVRERERGIAATMDERGNCVYEDPSPPHNLVGKSNIAHFGGQVLAHEAGHYLLFLAGISGDTHHVEADPYNLMHPKTERFQGTRLTRDQIETFNRSIPFRPYDGTVRLPR